MADYQLLTMLARAIALARQQGLDDVADTAQVQLDQVVKTVAGAALDDYTTDPKALEQAHGLVVSALLTVKKVADLTDDALLARGKP
jgi:hypothetical protein